MASGPSLDFAIFDGRIACGSSLELRAVDVRGFKKIFNFCPLKLGEQRASSPSTRSGRKISRGPFVGEVRPLRQLLRLRNETIDVPQDRLC